MLQLHQPNGDQKTKHFQKLLIYLSSIGAIGAAKKSPITVQSLEHGAQQRQQ
jgi:hypothetical protein